MPPVVIPHGLTSILLIYRDCRRRRRSLAVDDYYSPEINSNVVALPGGHHVGRVSCTAIRDPGADLTAWTNSFQNIQCYDTLKVNAIVNEIHGKTHAVDWPAKYP